MKIAFLTNHFWPCIGGIEKIVLDECKELIKKGSECTVITLNKCAKQNEKLNAVDEFNGIKICRLPFLDLKYYKVAFGFMKKLKDADIIHVHGIGFFSDAALLGKFFHKKPVVISTHGGIFHTGINPLKWFYFYVLQRLMLKAANKIIAVSENDARLFAKIVEKEKIVLINNGIKIPEKRFFEKEKNLLLFVGRLSKNKKLDLLIKVFSLVLKEKPELKLLIVGSEFDVKIRTLKKLAIECKAANNIEFLGALDENELARLYEKTQYFISASEYEGFGLTVIEAMSYGCIPLLNENESFKSILHGSSYLRTVSFTNTENAAKEIVGMLQQDCEKLSLEARKISENYSIEKSIERLINCYKDVLQLSK